MTWGHLMDGAGIKTYFNIQVEKAAAYFAAEVSGIDFTQPLGAEAFDDIAQAPLLQALGGWVYCRKSIGYWFFLARLQYPVFGMIDFQAAAAPAGLTVTSDAGSFSQ